jgi:23S rRNA (guanosine2251-2'-O)-methyltransferase
MKNEVYIMLDNVRSAHNVGSIFRTSDGAGVAKIFLIGYTPAPIDRFGRPQPEIEKTSLGASKTIPWEQVAQTNVTTKIADLKAEGFSIVAVEQTPKAISIYDYNPADKVCYIFGNEIDGVGTSILDLCDTVIEIPMQGQKESLNVGVSVGVVLFQTP